MENYKIDFKESAPSIIVTLLSVALWMLITYSGMIYMSELVAEPLNGLGVIIWAMAMVSFQRVIVISPQIIMREVEL